MHNVLSTLKSKAVEKPTGEIICKEEMTVEGVDDVVNWVHSTGNWSGKTSIHGDIYLNKNQVGGCPRKVIEHVFLHEIGHRETFRDNLFIRDGIFSIFFLMFAYSMVIGNGLLMVSILVLSVLFRRSDELRTELFSIERIGYTAYVDATRARRNCTQLNFPGCIYRALFYPSRFTVRWTANLGKYPD